MSSTSAAAAPLFNVVDSSAARKPQVPARRRGAHVKTREMTTILGLQTTDATHAMSCSMLRYRRPLAVTHHLVSASYAAAAADVDDNANKTTTVHTYVRRQSHLTCYVHTWPFAEQACVYHQRRV